MGRRPQAANDVIVLPKGGGAIRGMGEKFAPDLHTGTGNLSVPIALPPGRNGFQPQLSLGYGTGSGNGPFGLGWALGVPGVSRKTSRGVPRYDQRDVFILSGAEDLVPVPGGLAGATRYRPRTEGLFARIEHLRNTHQDYWTVRSKDGLVSTYGTDAEDSDEAVVAHPGDRRRVFAWKLSQTLDAFGNRIEYRYERDASQHAGPHHWDQLYLSEIRYADHGPRSAPEFLLAVRFHYAERPDSFSDYRSGFEIRTVRRCVRIEVLSRAPSEQLVRTIRLTYLDQLGVPPAQLPHNGVSLLAQIEVVGHDGVEALPPLAFGYSRFEPERRRFFALRGAAQPARSLADADLELVDLFGRGLPDVVELGARPRYWRNLGNGQLGLPREMRTAPAGLRLSEPGVQLLDADGDGRIELLTSREGLSGYFPLGGDGGWDERSFRRYPAAPSFNLEDPEVRLVDLDGDGVTDAIRSGTRLECFFNHPERGWSEALPVERRVLEDFPNVSFSDPRVKWADMTGDGLQDPVLVSSGNVEYWPALGRGVWAKRVSMRNSPRLPHGYDPKRLLLGDVDGDGMADLLYVDDAKVTLWINRCGHEWSEPIEITGTPLLGANVDVRLIDLLGNGVAGLLWSRDLSGSPGNAWHFLDFAGGVKPYLLCELDDHMGARTEVEYTSSVRCRLADEASPSSRWQTPLPFPVQVVASVKVHDTFSRSELTTEYSYHHGYWDGAEREFRGFGRVDQRDTQIFQVDPGTRPSAPAGGALGYEPSPPIETRTWFHQGPIGEASGEWLEADYGREWWPGDPPLLARERSTEALLEALPRRARRDALRALRGRILRTELYALDGSERAARPYTVTEHLHGLREEEPPPGPDGERPRIFFPHTLTERTTQWERGQDPLTRFSLSGDHDRYGQPTSQIQIAVPRARDPSQNATSGEAYLVTQTRTEYAQRDDERGYIVDRVARQTSYGIEHEQHATWVELVARVRAGTVTRTPTGQTRNDYDGAAFEGLPLGQLGEHGALVRSETLVLTPEILSRVHGDPGEVPPYLTPSGDATWSDEYPHDFRDFTARAGYVYHPGGAAPEDLAGFFSATIRRRYDGHEPGRLARGLVIASQDALGNETRIEHDAFQLLPARVTDPRGLVTLARYDYRVLQPKEVTDPNGNRTAYTFTSLGLPASSAVMGRAGETVGDTSEQPGTRFVYDLRAFLRGQPTSVTTIRRLHHATDLDVELPERDETLTHVEYSDGFGRVLQTRAQAESLAFGDSIFGHAGLPLELAAPAGEAVGRQLDAGDVRVLVSGWQRYDNKGRMVEKYEPFFSLGWDYREPTDLELGQKATLRYDPRGQLLRSVNPDGSEDRVVYGVPLALSDPEHFEPTPWESYSYDENDNAGRTHPDATRAYAQHWNTPSSARIDALGRVVEKTERNGSTPADQVVTRSSFDMRGNLLSVIDALGRHSFDYVYDLWPKRGEEDKGARVLWLEQLDAGVRRIVYDAAGNEVERRDAKGALTLRRYDALSRPLSLWARDGERQPMTLRERLLYDGSDSPLSEREIAAANLLGRLHRHYDEAGLLTFASYDFKGNVLEKERRAVSDAAILQAFAVAAERHWQIDAWRMDWQPFRDDAGFGHAQLGLGRATGLAPGGRWDSAEGTGLAFGSAVRARAGEPVALMCHGGTLVVDHGLVRPEFARGPREFICLGVTRGIQNGQPVGVQAVGLVDPRDPRCLLPAAPVPRQ